MTLRWTTSYSGIAHANEELISDHVRKAHWVVVVGWFLTLFLLFLMRLQEDLPSAHAFLRDAAVATLAIGLLYLALVGMRFFAHARPHAWHVLNWTLIWLFLAAATAYYLFTEGFGLDALVAGGVFLCVYVYRWLMHGASIAWEITPKGVSERFSILGHTQSHHTAWKEVRRHRVHPLTGAVELRLSGGLFHMRPRVRLIVPDKRHRKEIHAALSKILKRKR